MDRGCFSDKNKCLALKVIVDSSTFEKQKCRVVGFLLTYLW